MARPLRIKVRGGLYHVTSRGLERRDIVLDDRDRGKWLGHLGSLCERRGWPVLSWSLLNNHFHLFLKVPEGDLSEGMHDLNSGYSSFFNKRHRRVGPLLQGRFKGILVEDAGHEWEISRYVHLNPVRAGLVSEPAEYRWSSLQAVLGKVEAPDWLAVGALLSRHGRSWKQARKAYIEYLQEGLGKRIESPFASMKGPCVFGSEEYVSEVLKSAADRVIDKRDVTGTRGAALRHSPEQVEAAVCRVFAVSPDSLRKPRAWNNDARTAAALLCRTMTRASVREIGERLGSVGPSSICMAIAAFREKILEDRELGKKLARCEREIEKLNSEDLTPN